MKTVRTLVCRISDNTQTIEQREVEEIQTEAQEPTVRERLTAIEEAIERGLM